MKFAKIKNKREKTKDGHKRKRDNSIIDNNHTIDEYNSMTIQMMTI